MRTIITPGMFPNPDFFQIPTYDELFQRKIDIFKSLAPEYAYFLASDPVVKVLRTYALSEFAMYALLNERARATVLTHAEGTDLDGIGQFYGIVRLTIQEANPNVNPPLPLVMEADDKYRSRIADGVVAFSAAGPAEHYRFHALSCDPRVKDAVVYSPDVPNRLNSGGRVGVAVLSYEGNGVPSLEVLSNVRARLNQKDVKVVSDILAVEPAGLRPLDVVADIIVDRDAPADVLKLAKENLERTFNAHQRLGWDSPRSWIIKQLSIEGVYEVTLRTPTATPIVRPNQFPFLSSISLRFAGLAVEEDWNASELYEAETLRRVHERYLNYAVVNKRTDEEILADLILERKDGIAQPTLAGVGDFLGLTNIRASGVLLPPDEIALIIYEKIKPFYERGYYNYV